MENCSPRQGPTLEKFLEDHLPCAGRGEEYEKEGVEKMCDEVTTTHIPSVLFVEERCKLMSETELE